MRYEYDNEIDELKPIYNIIYFYDDLGRISKTLEKLFGDGRSATHGIHLSEYFYSNNYYETKNRFEPQNKNFEIREWDDFYSFNSNKKLTKCQISGSLYLYDYDSKGNLIREREKDENENHSNSEIVHRIYEYDQNGLVIKEINYDNNEPQTLYLYKYEFY